MWYIAEFSSGKRNNEKFADEKSNQNFWGNTRPDHPNLVQKIYLIVRMYYPMIYMAELSYAETNIEGALGKAKPEQNFCG